jgi:lipoprotein-anchoring transpeptidase ErfK/SrfK
MSRSRSSHPRPSRVLLIVLGLFVAVGVFVFAYQYKTSRAMAVEGAGASGAAPTVSSGPQKPNDEADAVVTSVPTAPKTAGTAAPAGPATTSVAPQAAKPQAAAPAVVSPQIILSSQPLSDAKSKADAGSFVEARDIYNAALISGKLSAEEARAAKQEMRALNEKIVYSRNILAGDPWCETFAVPRGGVLEMIAKRFRMTPELLMKINGISNPKRIQINQKLKVIKGPLHAVVDKSDFTLDVYFGAPGGPGSMYLTTFRVGLGKDNSTPTGKWLVEPDKKLKNPKYHSARGQGVIEADDPRNPLGEYWIALQGVEGDAVGKDSYGIHGTIEPETIGTMASQGCIRLKAEDIEQVYSMLVDGKSTVVTQE